MPLRKTVIHKVMSPDLVFRGTFVWGAGWSENQIKKPDHTPSLHSTVDVKVVHFDGGLVRPACSLCTSHLVLRAESIEEREAREKGGTSPRGIVIVHACMPSSRGGGLVRHASMESFPTFVDFEKRSIQAIT